MINVEGTNKLINNKYGSYKSLKSDLIVVNSVVVFDYFYMMQSHDGTFSFLSHQNTLIFRVASTTGVSGLLFFLKKTLLQLLFTTFKNSYHSGILFFKNFALNYKQFN